MKHFLIHSIIKGQLDSHQFVLSNILRYILFFGNLDYKTLSNTPLEGLFNNFYHRSYFLPERIRHYRISIVHNNRIKPYTKEEEDY